MKLCSSARHAPIGDELHISAANAAHRLLLASIHDVSPRFESEVDRLLELLAASCRRPLRDAGRAQSLGRCADRPGLALRAQTAGAGRTLGIEMFLHGFFHRDDGAAWARRGPPARRPADRRRGRVPRAVTSGPGESANRRRPALVEDVIGRPIAGFIAPAWLYGAGAHRGAGAIARFRSPKIICACGRRRPALDWLAARSSPGPAERGCASPRRSPPRPRCAAAPIEVLRIGVHPPDVAPSARWSRSIAKTLRSAASKPPARRAIRTCSPS